MNRYDIILIFQHGVAPDLIKQRSLQLYNMRAGPFQSLTRTKRESERCSTIRNSILLLPPPQRDWLVQQFCCFSLLPPSLFPWLSEESTGRAYCKHMKCVIKKPGGVCLWVRKGAACHLSAAALLNSNQCWRETEAGSPAALSSCPLSAIELT